MQIKITGKKYQTVRISLEGKSFNTPKKGETKTITINVKEIPECLQNLENLKIIKIEKN
jgi:hypothetical protein